MPVRVYEAGDVIGEQFQLIGQLGGGRFGAVFKARNLIDDEEVALKVLHEDGTRDRVRREVLPLKRLDHPNVVKVQSAHYTEDDGWFIVQELVQGESLRQRLDRVGVLEVDELRVVSGQILAALAVLHPDEQRIAELQRQASESELDQAGFELLRELQASGVVHRDIKPENIMLEPAGRVVLVDFGISSRAGTEVRTGAHTPGYVPPDCPIGLLGRWEADNDRYAAGATVFQAVTGCLPTDVDDPTTEIVDPAGEAACLPDGLRDFLLTACSPERDDRFATTAEMLEAWQAIAWESPARPPVPVPVPFEPWPIRRLPYPRLLDDDQLRTVILEIVEAEGPVLCARLYDLITKAAVDRPTQRLNRLVYRMVSTWNGPLRQVERLGGGQQNKTVYRTGSDPRVFRTLDARMLRHLPDIEFQVHLDQARRYLGIGDEEDEEGDDLEAIAAVMAETLAHDWEATHRQKLQEAIELALMAEPLSPT